VHAHARVIGIAPHAVGLEDDPPARREALAEDPHERQRRLNPVQDAETEHDVEALPEACHLERVEPAVLDPRPQQLGDRPEPGRRLELDPEPARDPADILLVVDRDHTSRATPLGQKRVEAVERADVEHAHTGQLLGNCAQPVTVVARDTGRVDAGAVERERVEPQRHALERGARLLRADLDRQQICDHPLRRSRLGDRFELP
jgi:hypothetical protein